MEFFFLKILDLGFRFRISLENKGSGIGICDKFLKSWVGNWDLEFFWKFWIWDWDLRSIFKILSPKLEFGIWFENLESGIKLWDLF